ncbi:hypothetical protein GCM10020256_28660 [Streptomyces thermocoprophilus]
MFLAGAVGVLVVIAGVFFLTDKGGDDKAAKTTPTPSVTTNVQLPPGVKCSGDSCAGKDAEAMGCSGDLVTTAKTATVGTTVVEVRYSKTCGAAWGRVTQAAQGDSVEISAGTAKQTDSITVAGDTIAYTPMVPVKDARRGHGLRHAGLRPQGLHALTVRQRGPVAVPRPALRPRTPRPLRVQQGDPPQPTRTRIPDLAESLRARVP